MAEQFETNMIRMIAAELYFLASMTAAREMYGKSYFSLGAVEKAAIDQAVWQSVNGNLEGMTAQLFAKSEQKLGFQGSSEKGAT